MSKTLQTGRIYQLNCSQGGVPKLPVDEAVLTKTGLVGDVQKHTKFHGGVERALCLYAIELIQLLQREGHPISSGSTGENVTLEGIDWTQVQPGVYLSIGDEVLIEISSYTVPCRTIAKSFVNENFQRLSQKLYPHQARVYASVLRTGTIKVGDPVSISKR